MSYANGLSPFRGKINGYLLPVDHFKKRPLKNISSLVETKLSYKNEEVYDKKSSENMKRNILGQWHGMFWLYVKMSENFFLGET